MTCLTVFLSHLKLANIISCYKCPSDSHDMYITLALTLILLSLVVVFSQKVMLLFTHCWRSNSLSICLCVHEQGGVLRGVHGEGEEDGQNVCHEVCEEETEERPQSGERDRCAEKVINMWIFMSLQLFVSYSLSSDCAGRNHIDQLSFWMFMLHICEFWCGIMTTVASCCFPEQNPTWQCGGDGGLLWKPDALLSRHAAVSFFSLNSNNSNNLNEQVNWLNWLTMDLKSHFDVSGVFSPVFQAVSSLTVYWTGGCTQRRMPATWSSRCCRPLAICTITA